ncbi:MAG: SPOR domain-containing protein [Campylobacterales bacterium]
MNFFRYTLLALLSTLTLTADNFLLPAMPERQLPMDEQPEKPQSAPAQPLPPIEPVYPGNGDRVMAVQKVEFWVQMGAFQHAEGAKALETKLKAHGLNARLFSTDLHRVAVGPYASREQAGRSLETLRGIEKEAFLTTPDRLVR